MQQLESDAPNTYEMSIGDISQDRNDLLVLMAQDILEGKALSIQQRQAMLENALNVEIECITLSAAIETEDIDDHNYLDLDLCYCLKDLAGMIKSVAQGAELNEIDKMVIHELVDDITEMLYEDGQMNNDIAEVCLNLLLMKLVTTI